MLLLPRRTFLTPDVAQISKFLFIVVVPSIAKCRVPAFFFVGMWFQYASVLFTHRTRARRSLLAFFSLAAGACVHEREVFCAPSFSFLLSLFLLRGRGRRRTCTKKGETLTFLTRSLSLTSGQARLPAELKHINKRRRRN